MHWSLERGWMLDVPFSLSDAQVQAAIDYTLKMQSDRLLTMMPGDHKEQMTRALLALRTGGPAVVRQIVVTSPEAVLYQE
jgi:hypothetical protein